MHGSQFYSSSLLAYKQRLQALVFLQPLSNEQCSLPVDVVCADVQWLQRIVESQRFRESQTSVVGEAVVWEIQCWQKSVFVEGFYEGYGGESPDLVPAEVEDFQTVVDAWIWMKIGILCSGNFSYVPMISTCMYLLNAAASCFALNSILLSLKFNSDIWLFT